jgi:uncharacterized phage-associated protein
MKDNDKVTMTYGQLRKLVKESKNLVNEDRLGDWKKANRALGPAKKEIAQKAKELYKQFAEKFITQITRMCVKNNISYHSDRPQDAAEQLWEDVGSYSAAQLAREMYLYDDGSWLDED